MLNLVSDSSCDLISGELNSPYARLTVAPMCLHVGGQDYLDTPELDIPALLSKLAHHRSSSACPSPAAYAEAFEQGEETICVTISSQLSGSYNAAMAARDLVLAEHPEKKDLCAGFPCHLRRYDPAAAQGRRAGGTGAAL